MYSLFLAFSEKLAKKINVEHTLSARARNAAARGIVKELVLYDLGENFIGSVFLAADPASIVYAIERTFTAKGAAFKVIFANLGTFSAACAFAPVKHKLSAARLAFRVVAPLAAQIAALKKYRRAYSGTVNV